MEEITVILNGYKRPEYLTEQVLAIKNQTIKPKEIWLWVNKSDVEFPKSIEGIDVIINSNRNFKYHGRFSLGLLAKTKYIAVFDDDTIPGNSWFDNCMQTLKAYPKSILGGAGVTLNGPQYVNHTRFGWPNPSSLPMEVDLVGHAWFFEKDLLCDLWAFPQVSLDNGEDIQFSFNSWILRKTKTICPPHPINNKSMWSSLKPWEYGNDSKASSNGSLMPIQEFYTQRDNLLYYYFSNGYTALKARK